ncbi:MAG: hypothetical protein QW701_01480 [Candidatus Nezhaarchaeales archaeon]
MFWTGNPSIVITVNELLKRRILHVNPQLVQLLQENEGEDLWRNLTGSALGFELC